MDGDQQQSPRDAPGNFTAQLSELIGDTRLNDEELVPIPLSGEEPGVADGVIELGALHGGLGLVIVVEGFGELSELAGSSSVMMADSAMRPCLDGAWACGLGRIAAVSFGLTATPGLQRRLRIGARITSHWKERWCSSTLGEFCFW
jgi:hypothetical protein